MRRTGQFGGGEALGADVEAGAAHLGGLASWPADDAPVGEGPSAIFDGLMSRCSQSCSCAAASTDARASTSARSSVGSRSSSWRWAAVASAHGITNQVWSAPKSRIGMAWGWPFSSWPISISRRMRATCRSGGYLLCSFFNSTVVPRVLWVASNTSAWPPSGSGSRGQA